MPYLQDRALGFSDADLIFEQMALREMLPVGIASAFCYGRGADDLAGLFDDIVTAPDIPDHGAFDCVLASMAFDLPVVDRLLALLRPGGAIAIHLPRPGSLRATRLRRMERIAAVMERRDVWRHAVVGPHLVLGRRRLQSAEAPRPRLRVVSSR